MSCPDGLDLTPNTPPVVSLNVSAHTLANGEELICNAIASDADGDLIYYTWYVNDVDQNQPNGVFTFSATPQVDSSYNILVNVNDRRGGVSEDSVLVQVLAP